MGIKNNRLASSLGIITLALAGCDKAPSEPPEPETPAAAVPREAVSDERAAFLEQSRPSDQAIKAAQQACESPLIYQPVDEDPLELPPVCLPGTTPSVVNVTLRSLEATAELPQPLTTPFDLHLAPFDASRPDRACQYARLVDFGAGEWPRATLSWNPASDQPVRGADNYVAYEPGYDPGLYARAAEGETILFEQSAPKRLPDVPRDCSERFTLPELVMAGRGGPKRAAIITPHPAATP